MTHLCFAGPLPPPVNGFSNVCGMMLKVVRERMPVEVFDRAPDLRSPVMGKLKQLLMPFSYFVTCLARRDTTLYLALSGGRGQAIDLLYVLIGKLFRRPIYIHHHAYIYINSPSRLSRWFLTLTRDDNHVVLSPNMAGSLCRAYDLDAGAVRVVSNAAFYLSEEECPIASNGASPLRIGYLSNITLEKGIVEFFDVLATLRKNSVSYKACIAGPVAPDTKPVLDRLLESSSDVDYVGPLYGEAKEQFYGSLDIFLFPTRYANEAEPLVIYEAMRRGVYVIACDRGSIGEMLRDDGGLVTPIESFISTAAARIEFLSADRPALLQAKTLSMQAAQRALASSKASLEHLVASMRGASEPVSTSS
jgi:glycosyltransferase involved in cell wall biosynthesis